jgi:ethanolamine utilization microcompartment shell protein EutL
LALVLGLLAGCGGESSPKTGPVTRPPAAPAQGPTAPTKEAVVGLLRDLVAALESGNHAKATEYFQLFPGMSRAQAKEAVGTLLDKREVSAAGVAILAEKGRFGPLLDVVPDRGEAWAKKAGVDPAKCVALVHEGAEVAVYWGDVSLLLIRCDDVGKL